MSHALSYQDPYRVPAGLMALVVHAAFIGLLVLGVRWQSQPPEDFSVELWDSLPVIAPPPEQIPVPAVEPAPTVEAKVETPQAKSADIELRDREAKKKKEAEEKVKQAVAARAREEKERRELDEYVARRVQSEQARIRAEVDAATSAQVGKYTDRIRTKIRNKMVRQDVPAIAEATFQVTLLPGGDVMDVELVKGSGYKSYDDAVERAIKLASPLPVPTEPSLQGLFRKLKLTFKP